MLSEIPPELHYEIIKDLDFLSSLSLLQTNRYFHHLLTPQVIRLTERSEGYRVTAVYLAATHRNEELIQKLLVQKPGITVIDGDIAISNESHGVTKVVEALLRQGSKSVVYGPYHKEPPLHWAIKVNREDVARRLLESGIDVNMRCINDQTPLHIAFFRLHDFNERFAKLLLDNGADVNSVDDEGDTALHMAVQIGCISGATILLERGADPTIRNTDGWLAFELIGNRRKFRPQWCNRRRMCDPQSFIELFNQYSIIKGSERVSGL